MGTGRLLPFIYYRLRTSPSKASPTYVCPGMSAIDRCMWSWAYLVLVARPRVSAGVVDLARFACAAAVGTPSVLALPVAAPSLARQSSSAYSTCT